MAQEVICCYSLFKSGSLKQKTITIKKHCYTLNSNHGRTNFSTQIVSFSRHLCNSRDARVDIIPMPTKRLLRKSCKQNSNIFALNKTENIYIQQCLLKLAESQTC